MQIPNTKWSWLVNHRRSYSTFARGDFFNEMGGDWVPHYESGKYDFAVLHLDQQCFEESLWDRGKGSLYKEVDKVVTDIPKVVIMHGTPYYPEAFTCDITKENYEQLGYTKDQIGMSSELIRKFYNATRDIDVLVFNSRTARKQWGCVGIKEDDKINELNFIGKTSTGKDQYAIALWHGLDPEEWYDLPKEPRVVTMISPGGLDMYYDRTLLRGVRELLSEKNIEHCHITSDVEFKTTEEYKKFLGRSLVYFNPTRESPMPRSRTEAMLSGCCVVSRSGQDVEDFIVTGENGVIIPTRNPTLIVEIIEGLIYDYKKAIAIGQKGKQTAKETFSIDKFHKSWETIINHITK